MIKNRFSILYDFVLVLVYCTRREPNNQPLRTLEVLASQQLHEERRLLQLIRSVGALREVGEVIFPDVGILEARCVEARLW